MSADRFDAVPYATELGASIVGEPFTPEEAPTMLDPNDLRARRERLELSQGDVAKRFGVDRSYVSHVERREGVARPWYDLALRCIEYEERLAKLPRKWTKPRP